MIQLTTLVVVALVLSSQPVSRTEKLHYMTVHVYSFAINFF